MWEGMGVTEDLPIEPTAMPAFWPAVGRPAAAATGGVCSGGLVGLGSLGPVKLGIWGRNGSKGGAIVGKTTGATPVGAGSVCACRGVSVGTWTCEHMKSQRATEGTNLKGIPGRMLRCSMLRCSKQESESARSWSEG